MFFFNPWCGKPCGTITVRKSVNNQTYPKYFVRYITHLPLAHIVVKNYSIRDNLMEYLTAVDVFNNLKHRLGNLGMKS